MYINSSQTPYKINTCCILNLFYRKMKNSCKRWKKTLKRCLPENQTHFGTQKNFRKTVKLYFIKSMIDTARYEC